MKQSLLPIGRRGRIRGAAIIDRTILTRIVALPFALAGLAECARGAATPVRLFMVLHRAATAARTYAISVGAVLTTQAEANFATDFEPRTWLGHGLRSRISR